ncbi:phosphotransferase [Alkanindiges illinoisensis]|uniref:Aminoglycoside phosphotransferase domain-containing protein n=1 Tax=Alkanindiges illinoisensis TaxID=197183 RepID=A0A4Y7XF00_9GAMM|nr:phosphotransferase [Alkanindiges illinoisensis]TEU30335.1 hypothetical protein E2B99_02205 [Alkanindiges illinoisensis]
MTQALAAAMFCQKFPVVFDWTILIESHHLDFAELNSLNCHSTAWSMSKGRPLIYTQIENLIAHGFKKFLIALFQVDGIVKQQIQQLQSLYPACTFKCMQVRDSWFFEQGGGLTLQGEKYLQHYINIFLRHDPANPSFVWVQKIQSRSFNPLQYLKIDPHHSCPLVWVKESLTSSPTSDSTTDPLHKNSSVAASEPLGFWLDIKGFAHRYRAMRTAATLSHGSRIQRCFQQVNQHCEEILLKSEDDSLLADSNNDSMVASRCFNQVSIDQKMGVVTKQSSEVKKLQQEVHFYQSLPAHLQIYFPRLIDSGISSSVDNAGTGADTAWYSLEYYPYKSLSQYFVYYALPMESWDDIFDRLLFIHQQFTKTSSLDAHACNEASRLIDSEALNQFYAQKLNARLAQAKTSAALEQILDAKTICLNGQTLQGFSSLQPWLMDQIQQLSSNVEMGFMHGDLCFSNILFEPGSGVLRLIDPRGDFIGSVNQGDPRYDLAKVLHSVHGRYDFMINDLFRLEQDGLNFEFTMPQSDYLEKLQTLLFDKIAAQTPYARHELILLESLLFLTMLPLHRDQPKRQVAFLLTGLKLLNTVYDSLKSSAKNGLELHNKPANTIAITHQQNWSAEVAQKKPQTIEEVISV